MTKINQSAELVSLSPELRQAVTYICEIDPDFLQIEQAAGLLSVRPWNATFGSLVRVIVGQQLSTKAAQAIFLRLEQLIELTPARLFDCDEIELKQVGLSRAKIATCQQLAELILSGKLNLEDFATQSDAEIAQTLTQIKGIGSWTAEIYLLFCLERLDTFPAKDLAIQVGYQTLKQLDLRPTPSELILMCEPLAPWRGAAAHLLWHYYRHKQMLGL
jgi:DNA-3-methyladenine glycosylase II